MTDLSIRRCSADEISEVMAFIDQHWRSGHVLARHRGLMDWQHAGHNGDDYTILCAWRDRTLLGVLGYIPSVRYDADLARRNIVWLALWKIREEARVAGLGLRMLRWLEKTEAIAGIAVNGLNSEHRAMYRALGWTVGRLCHYVATIPDARHSLIENADMVPLPLLSRSGDARFRRVDASDLKVMNPELLVGTNPAKSPRAFARRFACHPYYDYVVFGVERAGVLQGLLVTRVAEHDAAKAIRIVDFAGASSLFAECGSAIADLQHESGAEYVDFLVFGLPESVATAAGFVDANSLSGVTVPNYFEPFLREDAPVYCAYKVMDPSGFRVCRADGDQDRPNILP